MTRSLEIADHFICKDTHNGQVPTVFGLTVIFISTFNFPSRLVAIQFPSLKKQCLGTPPKHQLISQMP